MKQFIIEMNEKEICQFCSRHPIFNRLGEGYCEEDTFKNEFVKNKLCQGDLENRPEFCPLKEQRKIKQINNKERALGRSEGYWGLSPQDQWDEDKRLGILDWDGK